MSRAAQPNKKPRVAAKQTQGHNSKKLVRRYRPYQFFASVYSYLLADRYARGLLTPFQCAIYGAMALDPCGRSNKREWLCEVCMTLLPNYPENRRIKHPEYLRAMQERGKALSEKRMLGKTALKSGAGQEQAVTL